MTGGGGDMLKSVKDAVLSPGETLNKGMDQLKTMVNVDSLKSQLTPSLDLPGNPFGGSTKKSDTTGTGGGGGEEKESDPPEEKEEGEG